jgi:amphi-Trp domain-containing protein
MPEEQLFKTGASRTRESIAEALAEAAEQLRTGTVTLQGPDGEYEVEVPAEPTFETELERLTDSETGEQRYELEFEIRWSK